MNTNHPTGTSSSSNHFYGFKGVSLPLISLAALACLACSGTLPVGPTLAAYDSRPACLAYVEAFNALECVPISLEEDNACPTALHTAPCDLAPMYDCMTEGLACGDSGKVDMAAVQECQRTHSCAP